MQIVCNGEATEIAQETLVADFVTQAGLDLETVVVECDGRILAREEYDRQLLTEGTVLELIRFIGGG